MTDDGQQAGATRPGSIERRRGLYRVLEAPGPYSFLQRTLGAARVTRALPLHFLDLKAGMRVLDVGAGTGSLRTAFGDCEYTALEPNPSYVAAMRERFAGSSDVVIEGSTRDIHGAPGPFDRILMIALLHHLDDSTASEAFAQAAASLTPGGRVVTMDPCFHPDQHPVARALARLDRGANVRDAREYRRLAEPYFTDVRAWLSRDMLRVPYSHSWLVCEKPRSTARSLQTIR